MDREYMQEAINGMRKIVKPYLAKQLKKINFEGCGNTDKAEFETDFEIVLTLAEHALAIPTAEPKIVPIANIHFDEDKMREVCKEVAENIVVEYDFKGKTNGEVIKMLFPNIDNYFSNVIDLRLWWNSPYEPQESEE